MTETLRKYGTVTARGTIVNQSPPGIAPKVQGAGAGTLVFGAAATVFIAVLRHFGVTPDDDVSAAIRILFDPGIPLIAAVVGAFLGGYVTPPAGPSAPDAVAGTANVGLTPEEPAPPSSKIPPSGGALTGSTSALIAALMLGAAATFSLASCVPVGGAAGTVATAPQPRTNVERMAVVEANWQAVLRTVDTVRSRGLLTADERARLADSLEAANREMEVARAAVKTGGADAASSLYIADASVAALLQYLQAKEGT